ncbi:MAG: hypothetical protein OWT27_05770 [Firmicutes bacterium]|nr:hypothetical protein [Bacillota bacterium]
MKRLNKAVLIPVVAALAMSGVAVSGPAFAAQRQGSFARQYTHNTQVEASLWAKADASAYSGPRINGLKTAVSGMNAESVHLYTAEQALVQVRNDAHGNAGGVRSKSQVQAWKRQRDGLLRDARRIRHTLAEHGKKHHLSAKERARLKAELKLDLARVGVLNLELKLGSRVDTTWRRLPLDGALTYVQKSILALQASAIHYTQELIALERAKASGQSRGGAQSAASISGLAYAATNIQIPAQGAVAVTDAVYHVPLVLTSAGVALSDQGMYTLSGPSGAVYGASGVTIDAQTGLITVASGATAGIYEVTYAQAGARESVDLSLVQ